MTVNKFQISHIFLSMSCFFCKKKKLKLQLDVIFEVTACLQIFSSVFLCQGISICHSPCLQYNKDYTFPSFIDMSRLLIAMVQEVALSTGFFPFCFDLIWFLLIFLHIKFQKEDIVSDFGG